MKLAGSLALALATAIPALAACANTAAPVQHAHSGAYPEATPFDPSANAAAALAAAQADARATDRNLLVVLGANWCHDSRALAGWLQSPGMAPLVEDHYTLVYIDAGVPQTGEGRNLELAAGLGVTDIAGTPTLLVLDSQGRLLNTPDDARAWRNAASRSQGEIRGFLERWAGPAL